MAGWSEAAGCSVVGASVVAGTSEAGASDATGASAAGWSAVESSVAGASAAGWSVAGFSTVESSAAGCSVAGASEAGCSAVGATESVTVVSAGMTAMLLLMFLPANALFTETITIAASAAKTNFFIIVEFLSVNIFLFSQTLRLTSVVFVDCCLVRCVAHLINCNERAKTGTCL